MNEEPVFPNVDEVRRKALAYRKRRSLRQREAAEQMNVSQSHLAKLEAGKLKRPGYRFIRRVWRVVKDEEIEVDAA